MRKLLSVLCLFVTSEVEAANKPEYPQTCFSPIEQCEIQFVNALQRAERSIDIAIFQLNLDSVVKVIKSKAQTLPIRLLMDKSMFRFGKSAGPELKRFQKQYPLLQIRFGNQPGRMHHKFTLIDRHILVTGSFNYTRTANEENAENLLFLLDSVIVERYASEFERMWREAKPI